MEQCHYSAVPVGVPMGGGEVCGRHADTLVANQLEAALPVVVQCDAVMADGIGGLCGDSGYIPVRHGRHATVYLFSILKIG